jgi:hypothetical protein
MKALTVATTGAAALATPADAATVSITPMKPCFLTGESDTLAGSGVTANGQVDVAVDGASVFTLTAGADGTFTTTLYFGEMRAVKTHTLTVTDVTNPANTASVAFVGTTHQVVANNARGRAGKKVKLRGYGFLFGPKAYMHVRGHGIRTDALLGRPKAPCGTFVVRKRFVSANAPTGKYRLQFDAEARYSKKTRPRLIYELALFPTASSASAFAGATLNQSWTKVPG